MEALHMLIERAKTANLVQGIRLDMAGHVVSHLFYADDAIFLGEWSETNVNNIVLLLQCFFLASGLKINLGKCKLMGVGVQMDDVQNMATVIGCEGAKLPFVYLGVQVRANMKWIAEWDEVIKKFKTRLSTWKAKTLSVGGRLTLIKLVLGNAGIGNSRPKGDSGSIWFNILKSVRELDNKNANLDDFVSKKVSDGRQTKFWEDLWIGDRPLKGGAEADQWDALVNVVQHYALSPQTDRWVWSGDGTGQFSVSSARQIIDRRTLIVEDVQTRWLKEVPIKVNIFVWKMLLNKLPTRVNLSKRGLEVESLNCCICDNSPESLFHVMFECMVAKDVWRLIERWWKIDLPQNYCHLRSKSIPPSSSSTTISNSSQKQACILVPLSFSTYTPTPPQIYELEKSSIKMRVKHHEKLIESILNYLLELSFHYIEKIKERLVNGWIIIPRDFDEVKIKLKEARTQIVELQKKHIGQRDKIAFIHFRISDLEITLEDIQDRHQLYMKNLMGHTS
ncbi:RNA-directed DNA polymerase, eukaryota [Tanacetum coccineum]